MTSVTTGAACPFHRNTVQPELHLTSRSFPARIAELGFSADLPSDWNVHDLPNEDLDLGNPSQFVPLALLSAPHAAIVYLFAARPAYDDGTLQDWARYLLQQNQMQPRTMGTSTVAGVPAVIGEATQQSEVGTMLMRFAFLEDGGRLINITLTTPELFADAVRDAWFAALRSFQLTTPRGSRFMPAANSEPLPAAGPWPEAAPPVLPRPDPAVATAVEASSRRRLGDFSLAADAGSLDPQQSINWNLRDRGVGLVPNVTAVDEAARCATVAAGAIEARFGVPLGWHVIDDGRRTLVFEPTGKVQIHLDLLPRDGRCDDAVLDDLEAQARADHPAPEFVRVRDGDLHGLGVRNIADGDQPLEQYHLLRQWRADSHVLRARVTATPETGVDACNLAELLLASCSFDSAQQLDEPQQIEADTPAWFDCG